jgi:cation diffusion facilitator family transporter
MNGTNKAQYEKNRAQIGLRVSLIGVVVNALLATSKITAGVLSGSVSILADGINNLSDAGSVLVSMFSLRFARKPQDTEHPFGHARMEYIGALTIAVIILYIGIDLLSSSIQAIRSPKAPIFSWWVLALTAMSIPAKLFLWLYYRKQGKKYGIPPLLASSQDSFNDVLITSAVIIGLLLSRFSGLILDGWLGILVSLFVLWSGFRLIRGTVSDLIGGKPNKELGQQILKILKQYPEILGVHDFVLHDYGPGRTMASVHAEVSASENLLNIHEVIDQAEQEVISQLGIIIIIHMDPLVPLDAPGQETKSLISQYLHEMKPPLALHDYRRIPGKMVIKLIFDVTVPIDFKQEDQLIRNLTAYAKTLDIRHQCVILVDHDYFMLGKEGGQ